MLQRRWTFTVFSLFDSGVCVRLTVQFNVWLVPTVVFRFEFQLVNYTIMHAINRKWFVRSFVRSNYQISLSSIDGHSACKRVVYGVTHRTQTEWDEFCCFAEVFIETNQNGWWNGGEEIRNSRRRVFFVFYTETITTNDMSQAIFFIRFLGCVWVIDSMFMS